MFKSRQEVIEEILKINERYVAATSVAEQQQLLHELLSLIPEGIKFATDPSLQDLLSEVKVQLALPLTPQHNVRLIVEKLDEIRQQINARALQLSRNIQGTDLQDLEKLIQNEIIKD